MGEKIVPSIALKDVPRKRCASHYIYIVMLSRKRQRTDKYAFRNDKSSFESELWVRNIGVINVLINKASFLVSLQ